MKKRSSYTSPAAFRVRWKRATVMFPVSRKALEWAKARPGARVYAYNAVRWYQIYPEVKRCLFQSSVHVVFAVPGENSMVLLTHFYSALIKGVTAAQKSLTTDLIRRCLAIVKGKTSKEK